LSWKTRRSKKIKKLKNYYIILYYKNFLNTYKDSFLYLKMAAIFIVIFAVIGIWTGLLSSWTVAYATGLAQLGIWATL
jgi:hypothetical protein